MLAPHGHVYPSQAILVVPFPDDLSKVEIQIPEGPLFDVLLDATETRANPAALACVRRERLPPGAERQLDAIASRLGAKLIV